MPGIDRRRSQIGHDQAQAQPGRVETRHEDDKGHDHDQRQAEEVAARPEPMLGVPEDPVQLDGQGHEKQAGESGGARTGGHKEVMPGAGVVGAQLVSQRIGISAGNF